MGFEQLAELKKQLAKRAEAASPNTPSGQSSAKPSGQPASKSGKPGNRPAGHAGGKHNGKPNGKPGGKPGAKPQQARRAPAPAADAKPVNPTVLAIGKLQRRFPAAFPKNPAPKVPLKIGIFKDLVAHTAELGLDEAQLRDAIKEWCRGSRYWACLVDGAVRIDLAGQPAGNVTDQQAAGAVRLDAARRSRAAKANTKRDAAAKDEAGANSESGERAAAPADGTQAVTADAATTEHASTAAATPESVDTAAAAEPASDEAGTPASSDAAPADAAPTDAAPADAAPTEEAGRA